METLFSSKEVAAATNRTVRGVQKLAERYPNLGRQIGTTWVFTQADIDFINTIDKKGGRPRLNPNELVRKYPRTPKKPKPAPPEDLKSESE